MLGKEVHTRATCTASLLAVRDALDALSGKWKLQIIIALKEGPTRFKELQRTVEGITPKVLSKELKDMEMNDLVKRHVYDTMPVSVEYELTPHSNTLTKVINELRNWGLLHREHIMEGCRKAKKQRQTA